MRRPGRATAAFATATLVALLAAGGCHSTSGSHTVTIKQFIFGPHRLVVHAGQVVTVVNHDEVLHGFTADDHTFDLHSITAGSSAQVTLTKPGKYSYHCPIHVSMTGVVEVRP